MSRSLRSVGVAALLLTLLVPATSFAAPRHSTACDLIRDPQGDTTEPTPDNKQQLDIVSGDIAANSHQLTAVIRLAALTGADATQPAGRIYEFDFSVGSASFMVRSYLMFGGNNYTAYVTSQSVDQGPASAQSGMAIGQIKGVIDIKRHEVRMTAPLALFKQNGARFGNAPISHLAAMTFWARGTGNDISAGPVTSKGGSGLGVSVDAASSDASIYVGRRSCVTVGH